MRVIIVILNIIILIITVTSCNKSVNFPLYIDGDGVTDYEGNLYKTVVIGNQEWMAENLKSKKYSNGKNISNTIGFEDYKIYNNDTSTVDIYGLYYNYSAVEDTSGICPCDWHVPTENEYNRLISYLGGNVKAYPKLKSKGYLDDNSGLWIDFSRKYGGTNSSGYNAVPTGFIFSDTSLFMDRLTYFWSLSNDYNILQSYNIGSYKAIEKKSKPRTGNTNIYFYSIRCIKNLE